LFKGIAVNSLGHANPYLIKAINKQSKKVWHVSNAFIIPEGEKLAKRLTKKTFADYVIFKIVEQKQQKLQLKLLEDIFIQ
jgi:acetylornithine/N-succinyldiaminopimelate aminotransferase